MSMCVLGMAEEFAADKIAVNALWPRTVIATAALNMLGESVSATNCRTPEIVGQAAHFILRQDSTTYTGQFLIDDEVLVAAGIHDMEQYAVEPGAPLLTDLFLD